MSDETASHEAPPTTTCSAQGRDASADRATARAPPHAAPRRRRRRSRSETDNGSPPPPAPRPTRCQVGERRGMFGAPTPARHHRVRRPGPPDPVPRRGCRAPTAATSTRSPTASSSALVGGSASYAEAVERVVVDRGEMTLFVRREHLRGRRPRAARRPGAALRDVHRRLRRALPAGGAAASCTRSTTSCRSPTAAGGSASRSPHPTPTRTSRRSSRSTRPTTGTSARRGTCSGSSSTATRP